MSLSKNLTSIVSIEYIKPLCLPGGERLKSLVYDDLNLDVAGWGKTENGKTLIID